MSDEIIAELRALREELAALRLELSVHIETENTYRPRLLEMLETYEQSVGAIKFMRVIIFAAAPLGAAIIWVRDHFKW